MSCLWSVSLFVCSTVTICPYLSIFLLLLGWFVSADISNILTNQPIVSFSLFHVMICFVFNKFPPALPHIIFLLCWWGFSIYPQWILVWVSTPRWGMWMRLNMYYFDRRDNFFIYTVHILTVQVLINRNKWQTRQKKLFKNQTNNWLSGQSN